MKHNINFDIYVVGIINNFLYNIFCSYYNILYSYTGYNFCNIQFNKYYKFTRDMILFNFYINII